MLLLELGSVRKPYIPNVHATNSLYLYTSLSIDDRRQSYYPQLILLIPTRRLAHHRAGRLRVRGLELRHEAYPASSSAFGESVCSIGMCAELAEVEDEPRE